MYERLKITTAVFWRVNTCICDNAELDNYWESAAERHLQGCPEITMANIMDFSAVLMDEKMNAVNLYVAMHFRSLGDLKCIYPNALAWRYSRWARETGVWDAPCNTLGNKYPSFESIEERLGKGDVLSKHLPRLLFAGPTAAAVSCMLFLDPNEDYPVMDQKTSEEADELMDTFMAQEPYVAAWGITRELESGVKLTATLALAWSIANNVAVG